MKKPCVADKGKGKADSRLSSVWNDASLALTRAQDAFTTEDFKARFGLPSNELVGRHILKLIKVIFLYNLPFPFSSFAWF